MINVFGKTEDDILDPCLYGFEAVDDQLVPQEGKNYRRSIPSGAIVPNVILSTAPVE